MTVLSRLFRQPPPPPPKTLAERIAELPAQPPETLATLALGTDEEALRAAAIRLLGAGDALHGLAGLAGDLSPPAALRRAAQQRLGQLLDAGTIAFDALRAQSNRLPELLAVAGHATDGSLAASLIASLGDPEQLGELALHGPSPTVRQLAAEQVHDPALLARLLKDARGKDKNVYRILKNKRDALHAQERAAAEALAGMATLCASIERHVHQPFSSAYVTALEHFAGQWQAVAAQAPEDLQSRATVALERCRDMVARHLQQLAREAAEAAAIEQAVASRRELVDGLPQLLASVYDAAVPDIDQRLAALATRWSELLPFKVPERAEATRFEQLRDAIAAVAAFNARHGSVRQQAEFLADSTTAETAARALRPVLQHLSWLGDQVPEAARAALASLQAWEQARAAEAEVAAAALRQVGGLLRKAQGALTAGHSRQAAGMRRALEDKLTALPVPLPPNLATPLQAFDEKLNALQDWRSFAVAPKRVELIEQMEALVGSTEPPAVLAEQIKRLQDEWKLISKGGTEDTSAEWQRFHDAAQKAYEPCREHFAAQAKLRADNLEKRGALLSRLQDFVAAQQDWQQTDWRQVARALRESRPQWRSLQPVERAANKPLQEAFDALTTELQSRLEAEYTRNADAKRALIARAQQLLTLEDGRQATDEVKRLQQSWRDIGLVRPDESQRLWEEFRQHCDAVFTRREQLRSEFVSQLSANATRAAELCAEAERLLTLSGTELMDAARSIPALRESFAAAGELPKAEAQALRSRFERALERTERLLSEQRARDRATAWDQVFEAADRIRRVRLAVARGATPEDCAALRDDARAFVESIAQWPRGVQRMVTAELARDGAADLAANEAALRLVCIRAELFTGVATPDTDSALRREWQLQQLTKGFGQGRGAVPDSQETLLAEWLGAGATGDDAYAALRERFVRCWQRSLAAA